ncbi:hypothetical protein M413DRAFT_448923 [Hebeloma cylindrosporum]|uniref:Pinin/SDK/MemA protein domain-containing protein n=1 Tax=Hebeloma cylindrosporum TaxID=76867 RepID=A0A0C2XFU5_HEBCY|nr:hypothetical protein M413DRAFT_448923 [Hebeloma cylindrosporum h7]
MATEVSQDSAQVEGKEIPKSPTEAAPTIHETKKRPRLDLGALGEGRERKRGKSMFGILVGTLNKAKIEDKERNASDAAKKRQLIDQRLQAKLRKETDSVRRAEDAKKDKTTANRKEEDLQLKDSIYKLRRTRLPILANFLLTSDVIPSDDSTPPPETTNPVGAVPRSHPPPLYYLPAILLPAQETFIAQRKAAAAEAAEQEWQLFQEERTAGIEEVSQLRQRAAEHEERRKQDKSLEKDAMDTDLPTQSDKPSATAELRSPTAESNGHKDTAMDIDDTVSKTKDEPKSAPAPSESEKKDDAASMQADDDDAVEY